MDARDSVDGPEDFIGSAEPAKPPKARTPRDPERTRLLLLQVIAVGVVVTAVGAGITAWESHQKRVQDKEFYCAAYPEPSDDESDGDVQFFDESYRQVRDVLGC
ncbi:hypothetical protein GCM10009795_014190 [Nocardioides hankookensis]|uniref:Uncharacterized protein n=1 Tax=Nocardioides hankookensis TaxID=443157 RepID=A0ABW1LIR3_9ACTN